MANKPIVIKIGAALLSLPVMLSGCVVGVMGEARGAAIPMTQTERCVLAVVGVVLTGCVLAGARASGRARAALLAAGVILLAALLLA